MTSKKTPSPNVLRRGSACLSCRKRKLKCDGKRPICDQCTRMNRARACVYDDFRRKSRTQVLKEQVLLLERRWEELKNRSIEVKTERSPESETNLDDTDSDYHGTSPQSPTSTPGTMGIPDFPGEVLLPRAGSSAGSSIATLPDVENSLEVAASLVDIEPDSTTIRKFDSADFDHMHASPINGLSAGTKLSLLNVFLAHRHQCFFYTDINRFFDHASHAEPHPALENAMCLLGCHFTQSLSFSAFESIFFTEALREIDNALETSDRLIDIVQASCLLATYLYFNNRPLEAYRHAFLATRFALGLNLHRVAANLSVSDKGKAPSTARELPLLPIGACGSDVEYSDRVMVFWQVFMLDKTWTALHGYPPAFPEDCDMCRIQTPWPMDVDSVRCEMLNKSLDGPLQDLFQGQYGFIAPPLHIPAIKAKSIALYDVTSRLSTPTDSNGPDDRATSRRLSHMALQRFASTVPPFIAEPQRNAHWYTQTSLSSSPLEHLFVQTLFHASFVNLWRRDGLIDPKTLDIGNSLIRLVGFLKDEDFQFLDPTIAVAWFRTAKVFVDTLASAQRLVDPNETVSKVVLAYTEGLDVFISALKELGAFFPIAGSLAAKVELMRVQALLSP